MLEVHPSKAHLLVQFIVMVIPSMTSSRVFVRKSLAAVLDELAHILAAEVETFLAEERRARDGYYEKVEIKMDGGEGAELSPKERRMRKFTPKMLAVAVSQSPNPMITLLIIRVDAFTRDPAIFAECDLGATS